MQQRINIYKKYEENYHNFPQDERNVGESWFYSQAAKLGFSESQVNRAFYVAGATHLPLSQEMWRLPAKQVLQNLQNMEKPPTKEQFYAALKENGHIDYKQTTYCTV